MSTSIGRRPQSVCPGSEHNVQRHQAPFLSASSRRRPQSSSTTTTTTTQIQSSSDDIESLVRSLDTDTPKLVRLSCLKDYHALAQTIHLPTAMLRCQLLYALQQRENRSIQANACRDARFHSLLETLQPSYLLRRQEMQRMKQRSSDDHRCIAPF